MPKGVYRRKPSTKVLSQSERKVLNGAAEVVEASELPTLMVYSVMPCCKRPTSFAATVHIPSERYQRFCKDDNRMWLVTRTTLRAEPDIRSDTLRWETTEVSEHAVGTRRRIGKG